MSRPQDSAVSFIHREVREIPDNAVVIVSSDGNFSALMYVSVCGLKATRREYADREARDDIIVLPHYWLRSEWYHENLINWGVVQDRDDLNRLLSMSKDDAIGEFSKMILSDRPVMIDRLPSGYIEGLSYEPPDENILIRVGLPGEFEYPDAFEEANDTPDMLQSPE